MSIDIRPTSPESDTGAPPSARTGPIGRVIAGSLAAGAATALALTLGVFPGATESTTTGSILVAFGLGWALLAILSTRWTSQPQRWAAVPAAAMAATGLALLVLQPGSSVLTAVNWAWPLPMVGLVVWMARQSRRHLRGRGRWLLTTVMAVLALASVGATYENVVELHENNAYPAPGRLIEVNGHTMHLDCHGTGSPTVVLFNGLGEVSASWARISSVMARTGRVCAYDRAGQGWSEDAARPEDGVTAAKDLDSLLARAGEQGPFVLVGHSIGGTFAMTYAARYPDQVAGMVLLDSSSPEQFTRLPDYPGQYAMLRRLYALLPTLYRLGSAHAMAAAGHSHLPGAAAREVQAVTADAHGARSMRDEVSMLHQVFAQAQALTSLQGRPLAVLTASDSVEHTTGWPAAQARLAALSDNREQRVVESTHVGLIEDQGPSAESTRAITGVVDAVRNGTPLDPR